MYYHIYVFIYIFVYLFIYLPKCKVTLILDNPQIKHNCQRKICVSLNQGQSLYKDICHKRKISVNFVLIKHVSVHLLLPISGTLTTLIVCRSSKSVPSYSPHLLMTFLTFLLSFHKSSTHPTTDTQHSLNPFAITSSEVCCHAVAVH